ncbi:hypothetical protein GCM10010112_45050 [Actinoplanes lobatus]|uniref:Uncharacterized protein n=1 Tax=Actinoplanes lobatus TaxID=113568 RepID=A0ABQ4AE25_9ACTN|nr:hypothetical protein GCM10010112_45050 [Actinoplanes lobatus]GIE39121.1 hypothetical protein Alo02nite_20190 [Actinoplanes lobatus]
MSIVAADAGDAITATAPPPASRTIAARAPRHLLRRARVDVMGGSPKTSGMYGESSPDAGELNCRSVAVRDTGSRLKGVVRANSRPQRMQSPGTLPNR